MDRAFQERARARAAVTSSGIGAAFERNTSPPDLDGVQWRIWISDGQGVGAIDTELSASEQIFGYEIPVLTLQRVVERRAGDFPRESRLRDLLDAGRMQLRSGDFREADFEPGDSWLAA
jgi:hypothetical protein